MRVEIPINALIGGMFSHTYMTSLSPRRLDLLLKSNVLNYGPYDKN